MPVEAPLVPVVPELVSELAPVVAPDVVPELLWAIAVDAMASDIAAARMSLCFI
jgi:hypothetical protein